MPGERAQGDNEIRTFTLIDNEIRTFTLINNDIELPASGCRFLDAFVLYAKAQASQAAFPRCPLLQCCIYFSEEIAAIVWIDRIKEEESEN